MVEQQHRVVEELKSQLARNNSKKTRTRLEAAVSQLAELEAVFRQTPSPEPAKLEELHHTLRLPEARIKVSWLDSPTSPPLILVILDRLVFRQNNHFFLKLHCVSKSVALLKIF